MSVIISGNFHLQATDGGTDSNAARIGHESFTLNSGVTVSASSQDAQFTAAGILNPLTYDRWKPIVLPATVTIDLAAASYADYFGIAGHNLGTMRAVIKVQYSTDGSTFYDLQEIAPGNNSPIMLIFSATLARYWRVEVSSAVSGVPYIGVIYVGRALVMQRNIYGGVMPPSLNQQTKVMTNSSDTGQTLGRTIIRAGVPMSFTWRHLTRPWVDQNIPSFLTNAQRRGFFVAWRPASHPEDIVFGEADEDPKLTNMGIRNYMEMSFSMRGVVSV